MANQRNKMAHTGIMRSDTVVRSSGGARKSQQNKSMSRTSSNVAEQSIRKAVDAEEEKPMKDFLREREFEKEQEKKNVTETEKNMIAKGIEPVFDPVLDMGTPCPTVKLDMSDMKHFLNRPLPKGITLQCYIVRKKKGLKGKLTPHYELYLDEDDQFLLAAKKKIKE